MLPDVQKIKDIYGTIMIFQKVGSFIYLDVEGPRRGKQANLAFSEGSIDEIINILTIMKAIGG